jgi:SagB-type dehydrogenase family enzyme
MANEDKGFDPSLARGALHANVFKPVAPWIRSTGFRINGLRFQSLSDLNEARTAEEFLVNSRLRRDDRETEASIRSYFSDSSIVMLSMGGSDKQMGVRQVALPEASALRMELGEAINWRRSIRNYTGDMMRLDYLAAIVRSAAGVTAHAQVDLSSGGTADLKLRAASSAGGLYPVDLHLAVLRVEGLDRALYRYDPVGDKLWQTGDGSDVDSVVQCIDVPEEIISVGRANVVFLLIARPWRTLRKYGNRGMRYLFIEAGAIAQNIHLATVALGYGSVDCGSIYDDEAHEAMNLDGLHHALVHTVIVGCHG